MKPIENAGRHQFGGKQRINQWSCLAIQSLHAGGAVPYTGPPQCLGCATSEHSPPALSGLGWMQWNRQSNGLSGSKPSADNCTWFKGTCINAALEPAARDLILSLVEDLTVDLCITWRTYWSKQRNTGGLSSSRWCQFTLSNLGRFKAWFKERHVRSSTRKSYARNDFIKYRNIRILIILKHFLPQQQPLRRKDALQRRMQGLM